MRLLAGIWLVQLLTALVLWLGLSNPTTWQIALAGTLAVGIGLAAAVWIRGTLKDQVKLHEARYSERLAQKSHEFSTKLSEQKAGEADRLAELARKSGNSRTGLLRVGILTGGALGLGAALVMAQFVGLAFLLAAFSGGGATGYFVANKMRPRANRQINVRTDKKVAEIPRPVRLRLRGATK